MKKIIILLLILAMIPLATAIKDCERTMTKNDIPCMIITSSEYPNACNTYAIRFYNSTPDSVGTNVLDDYGSTGRCNTTFNFTTKDSYIFNTTLDSGRITVEVEEDNMASLAIMGFIMSLVIGLFILPFKVKSFSESKYLNITLKGICFVFALFLLSLASAMLATIAETFGIGVTSEIFMLMWIITWASYIGMVIVVLGFGWRMIQYWNADKNKKSMGEGEY